MNKDLRDIIFYKMEALEMFYDYLRKFEDEYAKFKNKNYLFEEIDTRNKDISNCLLSNNFTKECKKHIIQIDNQLKLILDYLDDFNRYLIDISFDEINDYDNFERKIGNRIEKLIELNTLIGLIRAKQLDENLTGTKYLQIEFSKIFLEKYSKIQIQLLSKKFKEKIDEVNIKIQENNKISSNIFEERKLLDLSIIELKNKIENHDKNMLNSMGIFLAIFSFIGVNSGVIMSVFDKFTTVGFVAMLLALNGTILLIVIALLSFIDKELKIKYYLVPITILGVSTFLFFIGGKLTKNDELESLKAQIIKLQESNNEIKNKKIELENKIDTQKEIITKEIELDLYKTLK